MHDDCAEASPGARMLIAIAATQPTNSLFMESPCLLPVMGKRPSILPVEHEARKDRGTGSRSMRIGLAPAASRVGWEPLSVIIRLTVSVRDVTLTESAGSVRPYRPSACVDSPTH